MGVYSLREDLCRFPKGGTMELLGLVNGRVKNWSFDEVYPEAGRAKHRAAFLFVKHQGVKVAKLGPQSYAVYYWNKGSL